MLYIYFFHTIFVPIKLVLQAVKQGDTIFAGQYLFTGSATTSVWLEPGGKIITSVASL
jgi:hypothetical protein